MHLVWSANIGDPLARLLLLAINEHVGADGDVMLEGLIADSLTEAQLKDFAECYFPADEIEKQEDGKT
jgi:hypothetical protein